MRTTGAAALLAAALAFSGAAQAIPDRPQGWVSDFAGILGDAGELARVIEGVEKHSSIEISVVTVASLEGMTIEDYSIRLASKWKVGKKGKDNGVLILVAPNEREVRIEVGYGLESKLTDGVCGGIIRNDMMPAFKRGDYAGGVRAAVDAVAARAGGGTQKDDGVIPSRPALRWGELAGALILAVVAAFLAGFGAGHASLGHGWGWPVGGAGAAGWLGGMAVARSLFLSRANDVIWMTVILGSAGWVASGAKMGKPGRGGGTWWGGGSGGWGGGSGGGFGGFGGGSFGGGGASGSW